MEIRATGAKGGGYGGVNREWTPKIGRGIKVEFPGRAGPDHGPTREHVRTRRHEFPSTSSERVLEKPSPSDSPRDRKGGVPLS